MKPKNKQGAMIPLPSYVKVGLKKIQASCDILFRKNQGWAFLVVFLER